MILLSSLKIIRDEYYVFILSRRCNRNAATWKFQILWRTLLSPPEGSLLIDRSEAYLPEFLRTGFLFCQKFRSLLKLKITFFRKLNTDLF